MPRARRRYQMLYLPSVPKPFTEEHVKFLRDTLGLFLYYERIRSSGVPQITRRTISQLARDTTENFVNKFGYDEAIGEEDQAKYFMGIRANIGRWYRAAHFRMVTSGDPLVT